MTPPPMYSLQTVYDTFNGSILELRNALRQWGCPDPDKTAYGVVVDARVLFGLGLLGLIGKISWLKEAQRQYLITAILPYAREAVDRIDKATETEFVVAFCDGRYVTWTNYRGFLDLETGENVERAGTEAPFESIAYNLRVRLHQLMSRSGAGKDANSKRSLVE